ncbi:hypothetical protein J5Y09_11300 [Roseomonas sp. PWR1]|uniref:Uncharacterized protein n=1 Tax=Roseomonas nitratireducens TaxID=2820810 RepID=A0ABS4ASZ3_9PROT|nr:hypothetical protein [Neoroseomonas nitratireducens]MBP0464492.1 hypothetical protein [Neoroseomonas nitratireducens]
MSLAEIREAEATPGDAAIYAGLRAGVGVAQVNLIWRHAATLPGVLDWLWAQAGPCLETGAAAGARDRIARRVPIPGMPRAAVPADLAALVATYNRGNLTNLAVLTAIRRRAEGVAPGAQGAAASVGAMLPAPPPLPRLGGLPPVLAAAARALAARHGLSDPAVMPSLYLHLAHWPEVLTALPETLAPLFADGALARARDAAVAAAEAEAPGLIAALGPAPDAPTELPGFLATLGLFTREVIPGMVPVGLALRAAFATAA